jgi:hypothetical protein
MIATALALGCVQDAPSRDPTEEAGTDARAADFGESLDVQPDAIEPADSAVEPADLDPDGGAFGRPAPGRATSGRRRGRSR